jgi:hypothetical protein
MRLFRGPREDDSGLLVVLQYDFAGASPAMSCPSIGLLVHLHKQGGRWNVRDRYVLETVHHHAIQTIALVDLTGDAVDDLLVESNNGGAGVVAGSLQVFDLRRGYFEELLNSFSRLDSRGDDFASTAFGKVVVKWPSREAPSPSVVACLRSRQSILRARPIAMPVPWFPPHHRSIHSGMGSRIKKTI